MSARHGPRPVADRLRRLLVMLPWLMERGEVPVAEMAARFDVSEPELIRDLELAAVCGLPPFVDEMIDVYIDEGVVYTGVPRLFTRPLRLTAPEGFALLAAGRAALALPGADPGGALARALDKLSAVLGDDGLVIDQPAPAAVGDLTEAAGRGERLTITHWSPARDQATTRQITPRAVFTDRGAWYVLADDHLHGEERTFRIDRIESIEHTGVTDEFRPVAVPDSPQWFADSDLPVVVIRLPAADERLVEQFPMEHRHPDGDHVEFTLRVTTQEWLAALLLRLGRRAEVRSPARWGGLRQRAAAELLERYALELLEGYAPIDAS